MNNTFENQLTASARRLREAQDAKLHVAASPEITHSPTHLRSQYWGWITTPVAAAIGLLIGLFINQYDFSVILQNNSSGCSVQCGKELVFRQNIRIGKLV